MQAQSPTLPWLCSHLVYCEEYPIIIVNQNALDLFASFFLVASNAVKLGNIRYTGALGYWLCATLHSELFVSFGLYVSRFNIAAVAVERYLKVIHVAWSKKKLQPWITNSAIGFCYLLITIGGGYISAPRGCFALKFIHALEIAQATATNNYCPTNSAIAFCYLLGIVVRAPLVIRTSGVKDGVCYNYEQVSQDLQKALFILYLLSFHVILFATLIFCYGRILVAVRRQVKVMAVHSAAGSNTCQTQLNQSQTNVIKTMILVSALYIFCHLPQLFQYLAVISGSPVRVGYINDASRFAQFLYVCANPFIYALKFDPVKKILKDLIPSRLVVWFNHAMTRVAPKGNRSDTTPASAPDNDGKQEMEMGKLS